MNKNYYKILGIANDANQQEIKKAYFAKAKMYHPDVCKDKDAEEKFKEISTAYETLKDEDSRRKYDQHISGSNNSSSTYENSFQSSDINYNVLHTMFSSNENEDLYFFNLLKNNFKTEKEIASAYSYFWLAFWSGGKGTIDMLKNKTASKIFKAFCSNEFIKQIKESLNKELENDEEKRKAVYEMKVSLQKINASIPDRNTSSQASYNWMIKLINDENIFDNENSMYYFLLVSSDVFDVLTKFENIFDGSNIKAKSHYSNNVKIKRGGGIFSSILGFVFIIILFRMIF